MLLFVRQDDVNLLMTIFLWHFSACLFLPWRPNESLRPFLPLLAAWAMIVLFIQRGEDVSFGSQLLTVIFGPGVLMHTASTL